MNETKQIIDNIMKVCNAISVNPNLYGIRNKETKKFITVGLLDNRLLFCDSSNWIQVTLWTEKNCVEMVYKTISDIENEFAENYFVDKLTEDELKNYCKENNLSIPYENFKY